MGVWSWPPRFRQRHSCYAGTRRRQHALRAKLARAIADDATRGGSSVSFLVKKYGITSAQAKHIKEALESVFRGGGRVYPLRGTTGVDASEADRQDIGHWTICLCRRPPRQE